jgi:DNA-binding transcriptional LysR family regulator
MDYNLFPVFIEIMRHRNISKAAAALGITQPAASNALVRLRHQFGEPLFIRASHGVIPTQFATDIAVDMEHHVEQLKFLTLTQSKREIDLSSVRRRFKIITQDMEECLILPALISRLAKVAPNLLLEIRPYNRATFSQELLTNQADIVMAYLRDIHKNLISQELFYQDFVCVCRSDHPHIKEQLSLKKYVAIPHIIISPDKGGFRGLVDKKLEALGHTRRVAVSAPHFLTGCQYVASNDYLLTLPRYIAMQALKAFGLKLFELPFELKGFSTSMHWHRRLDKDPEHKAIRDLISNVVEELKC